MPWGPSDAERFTKLADTFTRQKLWAETANRVLRSTGDEGKAVRIANSAVRESVASKPRRVADRHQAKAQRARFI